MVAAAYAPCKVDTIVHNTPVHVPEETNYPFRGTIRMRMNIASPLAFPLLLRIPASAGGASIKVNGEPRASPSPATFAHIHRTWKAGDHVDVESKWFHDSVARPARLLVGHRRKLGKLEIVALPPTGRFIRPLSGILLSR